MACKCEKCGKKYKMDLMVSNKLWRQIVSVSPDKTLNLKIMLCPICIIKGINRKREYSAFNLVEIK